jgi:hypothetical protein
VHLARFIRENVADRDPEPADMPTEHL